MMCVLSSPSGFLVASRVLLPGLWWVGEGRPVQSRDEASTVALTLPGIIPGLHPCPFPLRSLHPQNAEPGAGSTGRE